MTNLEKLAQKIFNECAKDDEPITMQDALEMAQMELNSKENCKNYAISEGKAQKKPIKPRTSKVSEEKIALFDLLWEGLHNYYGENAEIVTNNKLITVVINGKTFKVDLVETRAKK